MADKEMATWHGLRGTGEPNSDHLNWISDPNSFTLCFVGFVSRRHKYITVIFFRKEQVCRKLLRCPLPFCCLLPSKQLDEALACYKVHFRRKKIHHLPVCPETSCISSRLSLCFFFKLTSCLSRTRQVGNFKLLRLRVSWSEHDSCLNANLSHLSFLAKISKSPLIKGVSVFGSLLPGGSWPFRAFTPAYPWYFLKQRLGYVLQLCMWSFCFLLNSPLHSFSQGYLGPTVQPTCHAWKAPSLDRLWSASSPPRKQLSQAYNEKWNDFKWLLHDSAFKEVSVPYNFT